MSLFKWLRFLAILLGVQSLLIATSPEGDRYQALPITEKDAATIREIITTIDKHNPISLWAKEGKMRKKGDEIKNVHPLRFLGAILSDSDSRKHMKRFWGSFLKRNGFSEGLYPKLNLFADRGELLPYLPGFSAAVRKNQDKIRDYINRRKWDEMMHYLLE